MDSLPDYNSSLADESYSNPAELFGRPARSLPSAAELSNEAKKMAAEIFCNYEFLHWTLQRHDLANFAKILHTITFSPFFRLMDHDFSIKCILASSAEDSRGRDCAIELSQ